MTQAAGRAAGPGRRRALVVSACGLRFNRRSGVTRHNGSHGGPSSTLRAAVAAPSKTPEANAASSIDFAIPDNRWWEKTADNSYSISGDEDTFAWSKQAVRDDFEFRADIESDFTNYGEGMVVAYGDDKGWKPGCLIFNHRSTQIAT